jgi:hypothetical protein
VTLDTAIIYVILAAMVAGEVAMYVRCRRMARSLGITRDHTRLLHGLITSHPDGTHLVSPERDYVLVVERSYLVKAIVRFHRADIEAPSYSGESGMVTGHRFWAMNTSPTLIGMLPVGYAVVRDDNQEFELVEPPRKSKLEILASGLRVLWFMNRTGAGLATGADVDQLIEQVLAAKVTAPGDTDDEEGDG